MKSRGTSAKRNPGDNRATGAPTRRMVRIRGEASPSAPSSSAKSSHCSRAASGPSTSQSSVDSRRCTRRRPAAGSSCASARSSSRVMRTRLFSRIRSARCCASSRIQHGRVTPQRRGIQQIIHIGNHDIGCGLQLARQFVRAKRCADARRRTDLQASRQHGSAVRAGCQRTVRLRVSLLRGQSVDGRSQSQRRSGAVFQSTRRGMPAAV